MFPISIKIVVEEDAVDFGLHLTVPDKSPNTPKPTPPHHTYTHTLSLPILLMTKGPHPSAQMEKRMKERGRSYGRREEEG